MEAEENIIHKTESDMGNTCSHFPGGCDQQPFGDDCAGCAHYSPPKPKVIVMCGSSKFVDIMAVAEWLIERNELAITMGLNLLPKWYPDCPPDHLAEHEGCAKEMDELHLRKIDLADEIFVVDWNGYIGNSTSREIIYAGDRGVTVRYFSTDPIGLQVCEIIAREKNNAER